MEERIIVSQNELRRMWIENEQVILSVREDKGENNNREKQITIKPDWKRASRIRISCADGAFQFGKFFPLSQKYQYSYYASSSFLVRKENGDILILPYDKKTEGHMERKLLIEYIRLHGRIEIRGIKVRLMYRFFYKKRREKQKKPIIIFSDRPDKAGDNAEALFEYAVKNNTDHAELYFAVKRDSESAKRIRRYGRVIEPGGKEYKRLYWLGASMVSSQAEDMIFRPYKGGTEAYRDLANQTFFAFLQHGITKDDLSGWINRGNKNIHMLAAASRKEYEAFLSEKYGYTENEVQATGFPRYDKLVDKRKKIITVMFTWRKELVELPDDNNVRRVRSEYEGSCYQRMLTEFTSGSVMKNLMEKHGFKLQIMLHPCMEALRKNLEEKIEPHISILPFDMSYQKVFEESSLIITDYSSVAFDFAYLKKPVIYFQMDKDEFFSGKHMYQSGYFDYEKDGFGEVVYHIKDLEDLLEEYLEHQCAMKAKYRSRVEDTFFYQDRENCKRTWEILSKMIKDSQKR